MESLDMHFLSNLLSLLPSQFRIFSSTDLLSSQICFQRPSRRHYVEAVIGLFCNKLFCCDDNLLVPRPAPTLEDHPLSTVGSIYPPYLESVSSICNLRARHVMVTRDPGYIDADYFAISA